MGNRLVVSGGVFGRSHTKHDHSHRDCSRHLCADQVCRTGDEMGAGGFAGAVSAGIGRISLGLRYALEGKHRDRRAVPVAIDIGSRGSGVSFFPGQYALVRSGAGKGAR